MVARWILTACLMCGLVSVVLAAVTPAQKKEIVEVNKSLSAISSKIRKKEFTEAEEVLKAAESRIAEIAKAAGIEPQDKAFNSVNKKMADYRKSLDKAQGKAPAGRDKIQGVSFTKEVAPLFVRSASVATGHPHSRVGCDSTRLPTGKKEGRAARC